MRDVISHLDYNDVKMSLQNDHVLLDDAVMAHGHCHGNVNGNGHNGNGYNGNGHNGNGYNGNGHNGHGNEARRSMVIPAADVILPKIEGILLELKAGERKGTMRMRQIDLSLAEIAATMAKLPDASVPSNDASVIIDLSGKSRTG